MSASTVWVWSEVVEDVRQSSDGMTLVELKEWYSGVVGSGRVGGVER